MGSDRSRSRPPDAADTNIREVDLRESYLSAGLYRLQQGASQTPVNATIGGLGNAPQGYLVWRQVTGLRAQSAPADDSDAASGNYPQTWRNVVGLSGSPTGVLAVAAASVRAMAFCKLAVFDGAVLVCDDGTAPLGDLSFRLLFTHPWPGGIAVSEDGERLFVALNAYGRREVTSEYVSGDKMALPDYHRVTVTPLHPSTDLCPITEGVNWMDALKGAEFSNGYYFEDKPPYAMTWPVGIYEAVYWKQTSTAEVNTPPVVKHPGDLPPSDGSLFLVDLSENYLQASQICRNLTTFGKVLLIGTNGSGAKWRKI